MRCRPTDEAAHPAMTVPTQSRPDELMTYGIRRSTAAVTYRVMECDKEASLERQLLARVGNCCKATTFLEQHSKLTPSQIRVVLGLLTSGDHECAEEAFVILWSSLGGFHRTDDEISEAWRQVRDRRWYAAARTTTHRQFHPASKDAHVRAAIRRLDDESYKTPYGAGSVAGVQLLWRGYAVAPGECWTHEGLRVERHNDGPCRG